MFELYMEDVVDYYKTKVHIGHLQPASASAEQRKGDDVVRVDLQIKDNVITKAVYSGFGSVLSQGVTAYLCERVTDMTVQQARDYDPTREFQFDVLPNRQACLMLGVHALKEALNAATQNP